MKFKITVLLLALLTILSPLHSHASEQNDSNTHMVNAANATPSVIDNIIKGQLEAIRERNDRAAFEFNGKNIKDNFEDPQSYMRMLRREKQSLYNHVSFQFLNPGQNDAPFHKVKLMDKYGNSAIAMFKMEKDEGGEWKTKDIIILQLDNDPI